MSSPDAPSRAPAVEPRASLRRIWPLFREEWPVLLGATALLLLGSLAALAYPQGIRIIVDGATAGRDVITVRNAALLMGALAVLQGLAVAGRAWLFALAGERGVKRVREQLFHSLVSQEIAFFDGQRTGDLQSRLASDTASLQGLLSSQLSMTLRNAVQVVGALALLVYTSPRLTAVMLSVIPAVAFGAVFYGRKIRGLSRLSQDALADAGHVAEESLSAIRTVRAFAAEDAEDARYGAAVQKAFGLARTRAGAGAVFMGAAYAGIYGAIAVVLGYGGSLVAAGDMTAGALTAFLVYTLLIAMGLGTLADLWAEAMRGLGAAERVFELIDRAPAMSLRGGRRLERVAGRLAYEGVRFSYPARPDLQVLHGVDLAVEPGEVVALVGPSGAGKSTLGSLLVRLYDPSAGRLTLDGVDLRDLDPSWLRSQVGVVSQEPVLFSTTIADNVRYGRPGASRRRGARRPGQRQRPAVRARLPRRPRHQGGRARPAALRRPEAAGRHRPRHPQGSAPAPARRGHQRPRRRVGGAGAGGPLPAHARPHLHRHRPPALHRGRRRPGGGDRRRPGGRGRPPRRAGGPRRRLRPAGGAPGAAGVGQDQARTRPGGPCSLPPGRPLRGPLSAPPPSPRPATPAASPPAAPAGRPPRRPAPPPAPPRPPARTSTPAR